MATSKHLGIRDAVAALFAGLTGDREILENRELPLPATVESQIHVFRVASPPSRGVVQGAPIDWATQIRIVIKARKGGNTTAERIADALAVECYARVMADQTLGGLADELEPGTFAWDQDDFDAANVAQAGWDVTYTHRTLQNTIS